MTLLTALPLTTILPVGPHERTDKLISSSTLTPITMSTKLMTPANPSYANYFRRRTIGRAASPPTFACYEQRGNPYDNDDDEYSDDEGSEDQASCSEDGEDYGHRHPESDASDTEDLPHTHIDSAADVESMELDEDADTATIQKTAMAKKDVKGKQRAVDPEPESPKRQPRPKKMRQPVYTLRPILTIQRSQGFVWNQVSHILLSGVTTSIYACPRICSCLLTSRTDVRSTNV